MRRATSILALACCAGACDKVFDSDPPRDGEPPVVRVTAPARGTILGDVAHVVVTGSVTDAESDLEELLINGVRANVGVEGAFTVQVPVGPGTNLIQVVAHDGGNNETTDTRSVLAGPLSPTTGTVEDALAVAISDDAFDAIGAAASGFVTSRDLATVLAPFNPVIDVGGGPDCLFAQGAITRLTVGGADIQLYPHTGGLTLDTELTNVEVRMHLTYAAACLDGSRDVTVRASRLVVYGALDVGIAGDRFDVQLNNPNIVIEGLDIDLGGVPGAIVDLLQLDSAIQPVLAWGLELFMGPLVEGALGGIGDPKTVDVLGKAVTIRVMPSVLGFDPGGARVRLDTSIQVAGGDGGPGFVYVRNTVPDLSTPDGFTVALADDVANQAFAGLWAAGGLRYELALDADYGDVGQLFDTVALDALLPPSVRADGDGGLEVVVGDLIATFSNGGSAVTKIAINGTLSLAVVPSGDMGLQLEVQDPVVAVDILDDADGVTGANSFDDEEFEALVSFAATRLTHATAGLVGVIPLPQVGGVMLDDVEVRGAGGYVRVDGRLTR